MSGRILGLDPGKRRIGIALSDPSGTIATPHAVIDRRRADFTSELRSLCDEYDVEMIVVGLPLTLAGDEGASAEMARSVASAAEQATGLAVHLVDERLTSVTAEAALIEGKVRRSERKETRDKVAAAVLLQGYLDRRNQDGQPTDKPEGGDLDGGT